MTKIFLSDRMMARKRSDENENNSFVCRFCKERLKVELNAKTQIGKVKNGIDFLGFRLILTETGKVIKKLRGSSKRRIKRHLKNLKKLEDKGIVDREYVNIRKNCFYSRIENSDESRTFLNKAKPDY